MCLQVPTEAREDVGSSGPGVASGCELDSVDAGKQLGYSVREQNALN